MDRNKALDKIKKCLRLATRRDGKWVYYRIASEDALAILGTLHQIYCA